MKIVCEAPKDADKKTELMGVGLFESDPDSPGKIFLEDSLKKKIRELFRQKKFSAKTGETFLIPCRDQRFKAPLLLIGLGQKEKYVLEGARQAAARLLVQAKTLGARAATLDLDSLEEKYSLEEIAAAAAEGARLADYAFPKYKSKPASRPEVSVLILATRSRVGYEKIKKALRRADTISSAVVFARDLANEPANILTPARLAQEARRMAARHGLTCRILGRAEMIRLGMGGILGVSQGSANAPQFIILQTKTRRTSSKPIVLVGKGITFDTGGISIKPSHDMDKMKFDMCGAAAVIGTLQAIADLKLPVRVVGLVPVCENMPGGRAQRPGDIIRCLNKKTVEILNTDAEGRLILADALAYAERFKPAVMIDLATLTGACAATFSELATGLMSTDPELADKIKKAGEYTGERCWELPLWDEYFEYIRSEYADIRNTSKKSAGTITAAMFLKEFASHTRSWAHLDIAGTAYNEGAAKLLSPIGATGVGVRLLIRVIQSYCG